MPTHVEISKNDWDAWRERLRVAMAEAGMSAARINSLLDVKKASPHSFGSHVVETPPRDGMA